MINENDWHGYYQKNHLQRLLNQYDIKMEIWTLLVQTNENISQTPILLGIGRKC